MPRSITILILLGIIAAAGWTLLRDGQESATSDPWRAVPTDAAMVVEVSDPLRTWDRWTGTSLLWKNLLELPVAAELDAAMGRLADLAEGDPAIAGSIGAASVLVAIAPGPGTSARTIFILHLPDEKSWGKIGTAISDGGKLPSVHVEWHDGLGLISSDTDMLLAAKAGLAGVGTPRTSSFLDACSTLSADSEAHLVVNIGLLPQLLAQWFKAGAVDALGLHAGWAAFDLRVRPEVLLLSGLLQGARDTALIAGGALRPSPPRSLPADVNAFTQFNLGDAATWIDAHERNGDAATRALLDWSDGRITIATAAGDSSGVHRFALLGTTDADLTWRSLAALCDSIGCDTARHRDQALVRMDVQGLLEQVLGPRFAAIERPWYTVLGGEALFCDDPTAMRAAIDAWLDGTGLGDDMSIAAFFQDHAGEADRASWWQLRASREPMIATANDAAAPVLRSHARLFDAFGNALLSRSPAKDGRAYISIALETASNDAMLSKGTGPTADAPAMPGTLWQLDLPAPLARKPWIVRNHANGTKEVLAQDQGNNIHLISATGRLLWSRTLDGPVLGDVRQVDRFRNGKLQLLFNTAGAVHLIDRNGKDVPGFPITLPEKASAPLAAIDYEGDRDYRILLPTVEGRVLNYDMNAKPVEGWAPTVLPRVATEPVRFLRVHGKDHLLLIDGAGGLHVRDRRGATRYAPKLALNDPAEVIAVTPGLTIEATTITWLARDGTQHTASLDGKKDNTAAEPADHLVITDVNGRGIRTHANELTIGTGDKSRSRSFDAPIISAPLYFDLGDRWLVGAVSSDGAHLLDAEGDDLPGSPFATQVPFSIADLNLDRRFEVIVGTGNGITAYRLP